MPRPKSKTAQTMTAYNKYQGRPNNKTGPAKSDFDLLVRFLPEVFFTCPYDIYIVNS